MGYTIASVDIAGFRGFNVPRQLPLDNKLVILYAPNGYGKSSLCEAIEWVLYGSTQRRVRGEQDINKREFANYFRNRHYLKSSEAYVSLTLHDGKKAIEIKRHITQVEGPGALFVDGRAVESLQELGVPLEPRYPFILQHAIRDFIFAKPAARLVSVSGQLGVGVLTTLQIHLQNASKAFKSKPEDVAKAISLLKQTTEKCATSPALQPLAKLLTAYEVDEAVLRTAVSSAFKDMCGHTLPEGMGAVAEIDAEIKKFAARAFDASKLDIDRDVEPGFQSVDGELDAVLSAIEAKRKELLASRPSADVQRERETAELARAGLPLIDIAAPICPLCGQPLAEHHMASIKHRALEDVTEFDAQGFLVAEQKAVDQAKTNAEGLAPRRLGEDDIVRLRSLLDQPDEILLAYTAAAGQSEVSLQTFVEKCTEVCQGISRLESKIAAKSAVDLDIDAAASGLHDLRSRLDVLKAARAALIEVYRRIRELVQGKVASLSEMVQLQVLGTCLTEGAVLSLACRDQRIETQAEECVRQVQDYIRTTRNKMLELKSKEMMEWFSALHPGADVKFKGMKPTTTTISLLGEVFGEEVDVSSIFSEAQLNCLGLSFYAVTMLSPDNPFGFVVIDDPVQSMDQQHIENFKDRYLRRMLDMEKQVILLTHMQTLALSVDTLYRHLSPLSLELSSYTKDGPEIIATEEALNRMLKDIKFYMVGDSVRRRQAGAILRRFLERFSKDLYRKRHGTLPRKYENATWADLKELLKEGGLSLPDEGRVLESYAFSANFPHDDLTKEPPTPSEIESKYNQLKRLKEIYL